MKEITRKIHDRAMEDFKPVVEQMAAEGADKDQIIRAYHAHLKSKSFQYYSKKKNSMVSITELISMCLGERPQGSKAEQIFYSILTDSGIAFKIQYPIGPYFADFLIGGYLVFEIDGPQHDEKMDDARDKYMRNMGYKVVRVPLCILCSCPEAIIEEIRDAIKIKRVK